MIDDAPVGSPEWWDNLRKRLQDVRALLQNSSNRLEESIFHLREITAEMTLEDFLRHPERRQDFIDQLSEPSYQPTPVDEMVIQKLLEKEENGEDLRE